MRNEDFLHSFDQRIRSLRRSRCVGGFVSETEFGPGPLRSGQFILSEVQRVLWRGGRTPGT